MKRFPVLRKVLLHLACWTALIVINVMMMQGYGLGLDWWDMVVKWMVIAGVFYLNYAWLIPRFLFRRRIVVYVLLVLAGFVLALFFNRLNSVAAMRRSLTKMETKLLQYSDIEQRYAEEGRPTPPHRGPGPSVEPPMPMRPLSPREEEYERLLRHYERTSRFAVGFTRFPFNPFVRYNISYFYTLLFFYMAALAFAFIEKSRKEERRRSESEREKVQAELAYLKQQINPHFLFNTLNAIYAYTIQASSPASEAVLKLSSILRYMLYETRRDRVPLADEIAVVNDYIALQRMRITDKTEVVFTMQGDTKPYLIEPMLLIPILENAFKYGVDSVSSSFVHIEAEIADGIFEFRVSNRIVRTDPVPASHSGIGIQNIRRRLEIIYGHDFLLDTERRDGNFYVTLRLRLGMV